MSKHWTDDLQHNQVQFIDNFNKENPETVARRAFAKAVAKNPIDMRNYKNVVKEMSREDTVNKAKQIVPGTTRTGAGYQVEKGKLNLGGITDNRQNRKFFKVGVGDD